MEWPVSDIDCRYIRISVPKDAWPLDAGNNQRYISLAEIEIISEGRNVAKGKAVTIYPNKRIRNFNKLSLTDGLNHFGTILPTRDWMEQLARRHDLQVERPFVAAELNRKYARQKANLTRMSWLTILLTAGIAFALLIGRLLQMRAVLKTRERIAANLHDELSANLHALALLGEMAKNNIRTPSKLEEIVERIQNLTKSSRNATRHCTNMLKANTIGEDLPKEMRYIADRLLVNIRHQLSFEGQDHLQQLPQRTRNDLFLFYKECLTNIARHAEAEECHTCLIASASRIQLTVTDDGLGTKDTPASLKRRARFLRAQLQCERPENGGTRITLKLKIGWRQRIRQLSFLRKRHSSIAS
ncbi:histidine kinase [Coraliomargarita algicola]|uniref:histidine kinase n=1 Tax=Coraliomargarita algicola TaxID=3092156 RepID=A0ABZ0RH18_9BACT|nr:histidine kinase [Coraliomargarita sp. J2-16]WPJ95474.1 histidine kinase [Coraliomargarita sp. J2-16]